MAKWNLGTNFTQIHPEIVQKFWEKVLLKQKQSTFKNLNPSLLFHPSTVAFRDPPDDWVFWGVLVLDPSRFISHHLWVGNLVGRSGKSWMGSQHRWVKQWWTNHPPSKKDHVPVLVAGWRWLKSVVRCVQWWWTIQCVERGEMGVCIYIYMCVYI